MGLELSRIVSQLAWRLEPVLSLCQFVDFDVSFPFSTVLRNWRHCNSCSAADARGEVRQDPYRKQITLFILRCRFCVYGIVSWPHLSQGWPPNGAECLSNT